MAQAALADSAQQAAPWLAGRSFESWREQFDTNGFLIFERVLTPGTIAAIRAALAPHLARDLKGRNDFEGLSTNRVYALLAKSPVFAELVTHPLALAFVEAELGTSCLLSACLAINLQPGETVQAWHTDDGGARLARWVAVLRPESRQGWAEHATLAAESGRADRRTAGRAGVSARARDAGRRARRNCEPSGGARPSTAGAPDAAGIRGQARRAGRDHPELGAGQTHAARAGPRASRRDRAFPGDGVCGSGQGLSERRPI